MVDFDGPGPAEPVEVYSLLINNTVHNTGLVARYKVDISNHDLLVGLNYGTTTINGGNYRNQHGWQNGLTVNVHNTATSLEAFIMDRWYLSHDWLLIYGTQFTRATRHVKHTSPQNQLLRRPEADYSAFNPRVGLIYKLNDNAQLFGNVSRVYATPTLYQMKDEASQSNATLEAMHGTVYEIGIRSNHQADGGLRWRWELSGYYTELHDGILARENPLHPGTGLTTNIDSTIHAGASATLHMSIPLSEGGQHRLEPVVTATWNDFRFDNHDQYGDNRLPIAPTYVVRGQLLYHDASGFYIGPTFSLIGKRYADYANTYAVDSYGLLGLRAGFNAAQWSFFAEIDNLTDKSYIATVNARAVAATDARVLNPGAPFTVSAGFRITFQ